MDACISGVDMDGYGYLTYNVRVLRPLVDSGEARLSRPRLVTFPVTFMVSLLTDRLCILLGRVREHNCRLCRVSTSLMVKTAFGGIFLDVF